MIPTIEKIPITQLSDSLRSSLKDKHKRLGLITSIDGSELVSLILNLDDQSVHIVLSPLSGDTYTSLTASIPQAHWYERALHDLFCLEPQGHPRLKPAILNEAYNGEIAPLRNSSKPVLSKNQITRDFSYLRVVGVGIYELAVGPMHAGIIEPGHFRLSCLGETVVNLEIRLGFLHRGIEKRLTEIPWRKARFVAEAAASDTACANALAHAVAIESLLNHEVSGRAQQLRSLALEIERLAMHISDVGGMAFDLGYLTIAASMSRLRGTALRLAELLSGSRFLRGYICPGGVVRDPDRYLGELKKTSRELKQQLEPALQYFVNNPSVYERLRGIGRVPHSLAIDFGLVGVAARASNVAYDVRSVFPHATYPKDAPLTVTDPHGDALSRTLIRIAEIQSSFGIIDSLLDTIQPGKIGSDLPIDLPSNAIGVGIIEAFRGELIHLVFTDEVGKIKRYAIKDPSFNNWTGVAIAARDNVIADFPVSNKSFGLSYSGHDL